MNRYLLFVAILIGFFCQSLSAQPRPALEKPNVIIFFLDDSGYGDFSYNGNPTIHTPHIDRMSREGVNFTQFYVSTAACSASRYALLTGRYPLRSGLGSWVIGPSAKSHIHPKEITIAEGLKAVGYKTGMFGKWHLGNPNKKNNMSTEALPLAHGFDTWVGTNVSHDYGNAKLLKSDPEGNNPVKGYSEIARNLPSDKKASTSLTGRYTQAAVQFIKKNKKQPFFAYIPHNQPHLALFAHEEFTGKSRRGLLGDVMAEIDHSVGEVLKTLKEESLDKNTLVIFTSDNGPWLVRENKKLHIGYAFPFRDGKGCASWEGGFRVPGIFYWPGTLKAKREQEPASTLDLLPTLFKICGAQVPKDRSLDGRDIRSLLSSDLKGEPLNAPFKFIYSYSRNEPAAIRMGAWKLHIKLGSQLRNNYGFQASRDKPLLFQVEQDLREVYDRAKEEPDRVQQMLKDLLKIEAQMKAEGTYWRK